MAVPVGGVESPGHVDAVGIDRAVEEGRLAEGPAGDAGGARATGGSLRN